MDTSFGFASVDNLDMCRGYHCRGLGREQRVLQCMGEGEANGGGDGMAVGSMGVGPGLARHSAQ
jgi:hypothetical protein